MINQTKNIDTIAAIATPMGEGGIGIVRLSGKDSVKIAGNIFTSPKKTNISDSLNRTVHYGYIKNPSGGDIIDEVLLTVMRSPMTYTSEDVVEINCHGGSIPIRRVLELCLSEGARLAEPGEFTKRAFLSGRIDLTQAEAVLDIIKSRSEMAQRLAVEQLKGVFSQEMKRLRGMTLDILSGIELGIDFTEEDVSFTEEEKTGRDIAGLHQAISKVLKTAEKGMILRQGVSVVICGRPNVGKSSLMNALLKRDRAIVTPVPGTTRDTIEESLSMSGIEVRLTDTAGITATNDTVEVEGILRSREKIKSAAIVIFMLDASRGISDEDIEIFNLIREKKTIVVANKIDLPRLFSHEEVMGRFNGKSVLEISVLKDKGLGGVEDMITEKMFDGDNIEISETPVVANLRHKEALKKALENIERAQQISRKKYNGELLASDLNGVVHYLGLITGETVEDDILDRIFSQFCIGK